jgi:large subunit ribosomal protein L21
MLYAIVENGGKQYRAVEGEILEVDFQPLESGKKVTLENVLLLVDDKGTQVGTPLLDNVKVETTVAGSFKGPKIVIFNYRPKERYRVKTGHRQQYLRLMVNSISYPGKTQSEKKLVASQAKSEKQPVKKSAPKKTSARKQK